MHVEDHPLEYADFEGTIPPGNYGAGAVIVWGRREYENLTGHPAAAFHAGKLHIIMRGPRIFLAPRGPLLSVFCSNFPAKQHPVRKLPDRSGAAWLSPCGGAPHLQNSALFGRK